MGRKQKEGFCIAAKARTTVAFVAILMAGASTFAYADERCLEISVEGPTLAEAVGQLASQTDIQILFPFEHAKSENVNSVVNACSLQEALSKLFQDTGFSADLITDGIIAVTSIIERQDREEDVENRSIFAGAAALLMGAGGAIAQGTGQQPSEGEDSQNIEAVATLDTVIVTAQRREQNLQDVPFAVSAFGEDQIEKSDLDDFISLEGQVPGLLISGDERSSIFLRGIGADNSSINSEAGVPINIDGVYMSRQTIGGSVYADLASIEVLRGPQGTLYGRNATGGTVNLWTNVPDEEFGGKASLLFGNANRLRFQGAVNLPLSDQFQVRASVAYDEHDGYRRDIFRNLDVDERQHQSANVAARFAPNDDFEAIFRLNTARNDNGGPLSQFRDAVGGFNPTVVGGLLSQDPQNVRHDRATSSEVDLDIYSATLSWDLNDLPLLGDVTLKSVSAQQEHVWKRNDDNEGTSHPWINGNFDDDSSAFTQEFTLASDQGGNFEWVGGVWYFDDNAEGVYTFGFASPPFPFTGLTFMYEQDTTAWAVFGQGTYHVSDRLRVTGGGRYSHEEKDWTCTRGRTSESWSNFTPKASIDFDVSDNILIYASASKGFKAGGSDFTNCLNVYDEEELWAYEAGFKSELFNNTVRLNVNGFVYDYTGLQVETFSTVDNVPGVFIDNAGKAEIYGLEFELQAQPVTGLSLNAALSLQDSELSDLIVPDTFDDTIQLDLTGNAVARVPEVSGNVSAEYTTPFVGSLELTGRIEHSFTGDNSFSIYNAPYEAQDGYSLTNARIILEQTSGPLSGFEVHFFVNNIEDEDIVRKLTTSSIQGGTIVAYQDPQTYGIEFRTRF